MNLTKGNGEIIRVVKKTNFVRISNAAVRDQNLSWEARGVLSYLLSKPDDWCVALPDLIKQGNAGRDKIRKIIKELEAMGYIRRQRLRHDNGQFYWRSEVYECPRERVTNLHSEEFSVDGKTGDGKTEDGGSIDGNGVNIRMPEAQTTDVQTNNARTTELTDVTVLGRENEYVSNRLPDVDITPSELARVEDIYNVYPRKEAKRRALAAIYKAVKEVRKGTLRPDNYDGEWPPRDPYTFLYDRVINYEFPHDHEFIPLPAAWFDHGRYLDEIQDWS